MWIPIQTVQAIGTTNYKIMKPSDIEQPESVTFPAAFADAQAVDGTRQIILREKNVEVASLEQYQTQPNRLRANIVFHQLESFAKYVKSHGSSMEPRRKDFVTKEGMFLTLFDFGDPTIPGFGDDKACYSPAFSRQWLTWMGKHNKSLKQAEFATFIDDNKDDVIEPNTADLIRIIENIEGHTMATFQSTARASNGSVRLSYTESTEVRGGQSTDAGAMDIPKEFKIVVPVFNGGAPFTMTVRLKIVIEQGKPFFTYEVRNHEKAVETAVEYLVQQFVGIVGTEPERATVAKFGI